MGPARGRCPAVPRSPGAARPPGGTFGPRILGVTEVTRAVRDAVRTDDRLRDVWVEGEVGRVTISSAGHAYFTLKDERSQLQCVWFRDDRLASPFEPRTGLRVVAHGRIDVFDAQGVYQLYVSAVQPAGFGDLALRFEALKARLAAEGLFDAARKRPLPLRPAVIAVATSATGAVWHDIRHVLERRWPLAQVVLAPCQVQGEPAPASIVAALGRIARHAESCRAEGRPEDAPAVTILARGGGSLEDLWSFNDERVVRAIVAHPLPGLCGIGHETDVTLADFAADVRAHAVGRGRARRAGSGGGGGGSLADARRLARRPPARTVAGGRREVDAERRALDRLRPAAPGWRRPERAGPPARSGHAAVRDQLEARGGERPSSRAAARLGRGPAGVPRPAPSWTAAPRRWRCSGRRPRSSAATRSCAGPTTAGSCRSGGPSSRRRASRPRRSGWPAAPVPGGDVKTRCRPGCESSGSCGSRA